MRFHSKEARMRSLPIIVVGDFNVTADSGVDPTFATYQLLIGAGLTDLWPQKGGSDPGFTCCQPASRAARTSRCSIPSLS